MTLALAEIDHIEFGVQKLFAFVVDGLSVATDAFVRRDRDLAASLLDREPLIDALQLDIEEVAQRLIVERRDLADHEVRFLVSVLRIVPELERSADLVEHIALRTGTLSVNLPDEVRSLIAHMGDLAVAMWRDAAEAWTGRTAAVFEHLRASDDAIDDLHVQLTERLGSVALSVPEAIELGLVARFFERLGDHAVNVTRRVAFLVPLDRTA